MKEIIEKVKELRKSNIGKAILFFGFYFIFFFIISLIARFGGRSYTPAEEYEKSEAFTLSYGKLLNKNYHFNYSIYLDDSVYSYVGDSYEDSSLFKYNDKEYFKIEDNYFVNDTIWIKSDNPIKFNSFLEIDNIVSIINSSYFDSQTSYNSGKTLYNYLVSSNSLNKLLDNKDTDYSEEPNKIVISEDENKNIDKITYYLDSYCSLNKVCNKSLKIEALYDNYGKVSKIDNPIDSLED